MCSMAGRRPHVGLFLLCFHHWLASLGGARTSELRFAGKPFFYASNRICARAQAFSFPIAGEEDELQHTVCFRLGCCCHSTASHSALHIGQAMCARHLTPSSRRRPCYDSSSLRIAVGMLDAQAHMLGIADSLCLTSYGLSWQHLFQV